MNTIKSWRGYVCLFAARVGLGHRDTGRFPVAAAKKIFFKFDYFGKKIYYHKIFFENFLFWRPPILDTHLAQILFNTIWMKLYFDARDSLKSLATKSLGRDVRWPHWWLYTFL